MISSSSSSSATADLRDFFSAFGFDLGVSLLFLSVVGVLPVVNLSLVFGVFAGCQHG